MEDFFLRGENQRSTRNGSATVTFPSDQVRLRPVRGMTFAE